MSAVRHCFQFIEQSLGLYEMQAESVDSWKKDHELSMFCFDVEDLIINGISLYNRIAKLLDSDWRYPDNNESDHFGQRMEGVFVRWVRVTKSVLALYSHIKDEYRKRGFDLGKVQRLNECLKKGEVRVSDRRIYKEIAALTPDNAALLRLAEANPPADSWYEQDALSPPTSAR